MWHHFSWPWICTTNHLEAEVTGFRHWGSNWGCSKSHTKDSTHFRDWKRKQRRGLFVKAIVSLTTTHYLQICINSYLLTSKRWATRIVFCTICLQPETETCSSATIICIAGIKVARENHKSWTFMVHVFVFESCDNNDSHGVLSKINNTPKRP